MKTIHPTASKIVCCIPCPRGSLIGEFAIPPNPRGLVIFSQGRGSWSDSRSWNAAWELHSRGFATLLVDLLTPSETELEASKTFRQLEIPLLTERLIAATHWASQQDQFAGLAVGYLGIDDGAVAAIEAAMLIPEVRTLVCRSAPTELVEGVLDELRVPILFLVAEFDRRTVNFNEKALAKLHCTRKLSIVKGASHLFSEEGVLRDVARLAADWFDSYLAEPNDAAVEEFWG